MGDRASLGSLLRAPLRADGPRHFRETTSRSAHAAAVRLASSQPLERARVRRMAWSALAIGANTVERAHASVSERAERDHGGFIGAFAIRFRISRGRSSRRPARVRVRGHCARRVHDHDDRGVSHYVRHNHDHDDCGASSARKDKGGNRLLHPFHRGRDRREAPAVGVLRGACA